MGTVGFCSHWHGDFPHYYDELFPVMGSFPFLWVFLPTFPHFQIIFPTYFWQILWRSIKSIFLSGWGPRTQYPGGGDRIWLPHTCFHLIWKCSNGPAEPDQSGKLAQTQHFALKYSMLFLTKFFLVYIPLFTRVFAKFNWNIFDLFWAHLAHWCFCHKQGEWSRNKKRENKSVFGSGKNRFDYYFVNTILC